MGRSLQYRLLAYVCGVDCVRTVDDEATRSFDTIFRARPDGCRYAVVSHWNTARHGDDVLVFDLYEVNMNIQTGTLQTPEAVRRTHDLDSAIMATALLYDEEG